jgi:hypothetical protein
MRMIILLTGLAIVIQPQLVYSCGDETHHPTKPVFCRSSSNDVGRVVEIDECIAPIIDAMQKGGIYTLTSCCGHGKGDGYILLENGGLTVWKEKTREAAVTRYKKDFQAKSGEWDAVHQEKKQQVDTKQKAKEGK